MKATATLSFFRHAQYRARRIFGVPGYWLNDPSPEIRSRLTNVVCVIACIVAATMGMHTTRTAAAEAAAAAAPLSGAIPAHAMTIQTIPARTIPARTIPAQTVTAHAAQRAAFLQWLAAIVGSAALGNIALGMPQLRTPLAKSILCGMALIVFSCTTDPREFEQWSLGATFLPGLMASLYVSALDACPPPGG